MRLQTRLTAAICAGLAIAAAACSAASWWFSNDLIRESVGRRLDAETRDIAAELAAESTRAASLARLVAALPSVKEAFAKGDRASLETLLVPAFQALRDDGVEQLQFHTPPAVSFLRVHSVKKFGDDLSGFRQTVVEANRDRRAISGLETGVAGVGIRGVVPVSDQGRHLGTIEFGLSFGQGFVAAHTAKTGARIAVYLDQPGGFAQHASTFPNGETFMPDELEAGGDGRLARTELLIDGRPFTSVLRPLLDYSGARVGVLAVAVDHGDLNEISRRAMKVFGTVSGLMLGLGAALAWWLQRDIGLPLRTMTARMSELAAGRNDVDIPADSRIDEIQAMAAAVQTFREAAIEKARLEAEAAEARAAAERERATNEARQALRTREQREAMTALAVGLEKLSGGDLTHRLAEAFAADYETLRADFNAALDQLQTTMRVVSGNTHGIQAGSGEISEAADDLSHRTERQAASLEETAAALDEITAAIRRTSEGADRAHALVIQAKGGAARSGDVVRSAVAAMGQIGDSSRQVTQIIGVIDEIAFQTNLLALNAGVGAGRGGRPGLRGRRDRGAGPGPALGLRRQGDQDLDRPLGGSCLERRRPRRPGGRGARRHRGQGDRDRRDHRHDRGLRAGAGERASGGEHRDQPDGSGHPAERRHGRAIDGRDPCARPGSREPLPADRPVPRGRRLRVLAP